jgi:hypothetical protein
MNGETLGSRMSVLAGASEECWACCSPGLSKLSIAMGFGFMTRCVRDGNLMAGLASRSGWTPPGERER